MIVFLNECIWIWLGTGQRDYQIHSLINNINTVHLWAENFFNFREELSYLWSHFTLHNMILKLLSRGGLFHACPARVRIRKTRLRLPDRLCSPTCTQVWVPLGLSLLVKKLKAKMKKYANFKLCWKHTYTQGMNRGTKEVRLLSVFGDSTNWGIDDFKLMSGIQKAQNWKHLVFWDWKVSSCLFLYSCDFFPVFNTFSPCVCLHFQEDVFTYTSLSF